MNGYKIMGYVVIIFAMVSSFSTTAFADQVADQIASQATELNNTGIIEAKNGNFDEGIDIVRQASRLNPDDKSIRKNLSYMLTDRARELMKTKDMDRVEDLLLEAVIHQPDNGTALVILGDIYYMYRSEFRKAIAMWEKAHGTMSFAEWKPVADRISQAQRDLFIERDYTSDKTTHFDIRYQSKKHTGSEDFGKWLEEAYENIVAHFGDGPPTITVIVYADADLSRTYNQRDWAVGFYDGRLRVKGSELNGPWASSLILHELAHAFLHYLYGNGLPIWVHEGFAQIQEGSREREGEELRFEQMVKSGNDWVPLKWLDDKFSHPSDRNDVARAYVQARLVVEELIKEHGMNQFKYFLAEMSRGVPVEQAYDRVFKPARWTRTNRPIFQRN